MLPSWGENCYHEGLIFGKKPIHVVMHSEAKGVLLSTTDKFGMCPLGSLSTKDKLGVGPLSLKCAYRWSFSKSWGSLKVQWSLSL